jgi:glycosyltransferase involved in cell wall biosynthesis
MFEPLVSVIVNNYNYARFLPDAIDSALRQTYGHVEVIVVDDGSTDESRVVIASYGNRIRAVLKRNGGQGSAFNAVRGRARRAHCVPGFGRHVCAGEGRALRSRPR